MRFGLPIVFVLLVLSCSSTIRNGDTSQEINVKMVYTETEVLEQLDSAFKNLPTSYFPEGQQGDIKYNFFLDLEDGYCEIASSRIHLYSDSTRWAIVFETGGYHNRRHAGVINITFVGNCIAYPVDKYSERSYISNMSSVLLIEESEFQRIENKDGVEMENFELIGSNTTDIKIRDTSIIFERDFKKYESLGIKTREYDNPKKLIGFGELLRYLNETSPQLISATEADIQKHIPSDLPKVITIEQFHYVSAYDKGALPSEQETYQLIAKVLVTRSASSWKPTLPANNHWANWESGGL